MTSILDRQAVCAAIVMAVSLSGRAGPPSHQARREEVREPMPSVNDSSAPAVLPEFTAAIKKGDLAKVVQLLDGNLEQINLPVGPQGWTPLQRSIRYGHQKFAEVSARGK